MVDVEGKALICETSGKVCYSEREAGTLINDYRKHFYDGHGVSCNRRCSGNEIPKRKYLCKECGYYHVTHFKHMISKDKRQWLEECA